jgi:hypothetical protein
VHALQLHFGRAWFRYFPKMPTNALLLAGAFAIAHGSPVHLMIAKENAKELKYVGEPAIAQSWLFPVTTVACTKFSQDNK